MAIERPCDECGTTYVAKTKRSKFCSATCRVRANRRPDKIGAAAKAVVDGESDKAAPPAKPVYDTLAEQVRESLDELKALDTISGMAALRVAQQIDRGGDSGSAVATLSKELSRLVSEAKTESMAKHKDEADDIMERVGNKILHLVS